MKDLLIPKYLSIAAPYGLFVAVLYLFAFWGTFKLNILEFIGFADLAKLALYPLAASFIFLLTGTAISELVIGDSLPPGGGAYTKIGSFGRRHSRLLLAIYILLIFALVVFVRNPFKWIVIASLLSFLSTVLTHLNIFISLIPNPRARANILFLLILIPGFAFAYGKIEANAITQGYAPYFVDAQSSKLQLSNAPDEPISYVGYIAENFILYENATKKIIFIPIKGRELLVLKPNPKSSLGVY